MFLLGEFLLEVLVEGEPVLELLAERARRDDLVDDDLAGHPVDVDVLAVLLAEFALALGALLLVVDRL
ncbi:hypothetical protein [Halalkalicoccus salilacus]|uniref:hypothetical protein n=1 Tax=Halalkalicoccus sp. GCM10025704 TaxID=3252662 RepID=UPI003621FD61